MFKSTENRPYLVTLNDLIGAARDLMPLYIEACNARLPEEGHRHGLCFSVSFTPLPFPDIVTIRVGEMPSFEKAEKYYRLSQGKILCLAQHPEHDTSWESRDPDNGRYGGAVRTPYGIVSCSGLCESDDTAVVLVFSQTLRLLSEERVKVIAGKTGAQLFDWSW